MSSDPADEVSPRRKALDYLATHNVVTLATQGPEGLWAAAVFFANDGFRLIFLSAAHTRHARNLAVSPRVAATIQEDYRDWPDIKGIQLEGTVDPLDGVARAEAVAHYLAKFPFLSRPESGLAAALSRVNWYALTPERLYFIDNSLGLGHRDEIDLMDDRADRRA